jgi:hypothetical protein
MQFWKQRQTKSSSALYLKCGAIFLLFLLSVLIVACGGNPNNTDLGQPAATVTVNLNQSNGSSTPTIPEYTCSVWVTNASPGINTPAIGVYAKFVHNVNGNPEGVSAATGTATVLWPDGNIANITANTTPDGLAVFPVSTANRAVDLNRIVLVTVNFQGPSGVQCKVEANQAAFFTLVIATGTATGSPTAGAGSPIATASVFPIFDPTPCPFKNPKRCH